MAKSTMKSTKKRKPSRSPTWLGATKHSRTNNRTPVPWGSGQSNNATTQSRSRRATVQTEEDTASHGEDAEVIEVDASKSNIAKESSSESEEEASEDELG
jgi:hypothetical protein